MTVKNDPDLEINPENIRPFQSFVYSVVIPIVCIPGLVGAIICIIIFTRKQMRSSLNIYLAGLSLFDFVLLLMSVIIYPLMEACIQQVIFKHD